LIEDVVAADPKKFSAEFPRGEVYLWIPTDEPACIRQMCADGIALLSIPERQNLANLKNRLIADRFLLGRVLMRRVLAGYLGEEPAALTLRNSANGKPELADRTETPLSFNLSHSAADVVLAVARTSAIGVDIEGKGRAHAAHRIARRFFSDVEINDLETLGADAPERALQLWSLKESIVKANGETVWDGLSKTSLAIEGHRIDWPASRNASDATWHLAGGTFRDTRFLAVAVKSTGAKSDKPLRFRTYRLGTEAYEIPGFEPEISTWIG